MTEQSPAQLAPGEHLSQPESPTVWRRWLALKLRHLRTERGLTQRQAAKAADRTAMHLSNIENVVQGVGLPDLEKLLDAYDVPDDEWHHYITAAERSRTPGWWERYDRSEVPEWFSLYVGLEQGASRVQSYQQMCIAGLMQTADYAVAALGSSFLPRTKPHIHRLVDMRMKRQEAVRRTTNPLELSVVLDESTLRRVFGGPAVMAAQLHHIAELAERPNVDLRILPFNVSSPAVPTNFNILDFPWVNDPGLTYVEVVDSAFFLEGPREVNTHQLVYDSLCLKSLAPSESIPFIRQIAREIEP